MQWMFSFCLSLCACEWQHILAFSSLLPQATSHFLFLPFPVTPSSCLPFPPCVHAGRWLCVFRDRKEKEESLWNLRVPVVAALLPPVLPSSLFLSPYRQLWIWHLNKYESALFFFSFCLRIHTLLTSSDAEAAEGRFSLIRSSSIEHIRACGKKIKCHNHTQVV